MRRLLVLIRALPADAVLWAVMREAEELAKIPTVDKIRERQAFYDQQRSKEV